MFYSEKELYAPVSKVHSNNFLLLDLAILKQKDIQQKIEQRAKELSCDQKALREAFEDLLVSIEDLQNKVGGVVLSMESLKRPYKHCDGSKSEVEDNPSQFLVKEYGKYLLLGVKVDLERGEQFLELLSSGHLKKVKIYSFDLIEEDLEQSLLSMRELIKQILQSAKNPIIHLNLSLKSTKALKVLKRELILQSYPIERCIIQTNLLNMIQKTFHLDVKHSWEQLAFKYLQAIKKYIPSAIGCLIENIDNGLESSEEDDIEGIYKCLNMINRRQEETQELQHKKWHKTGLCVPGSALQELVPHLSHDIDDKRKVRCEFDSLILVKLSRILSGKLYPEAIAYY